MLQKIKNNNIYRIMQREKILLGFKSFIIILLGLYFLLGFMFGGPLALHVAMANSLVLTLPTALMADDKHKTDILLNSLPIAKREIIIGRYLAFLIMVLFLLIVFSIFHYLNEGTYFYFLGILVVFGSLPPLTLAQILVALGISLMIIAIFLPLKFIKGYYQKQVLFFFLTGSIIIGPVLFYTKHFKLTGETIMDTKIINYSLGWTIVFLLATILLFFASLLWSIRQYERIEF